MANGTKHTCKYGHPKVWPYKQRHVRKDGSVVWYELLRCKECNDRSNKAAQAGYSSVHVSKMLYGAIAARADLRGRTIKAEVAALLTWALKNPK